MSPAERVFYLDCYFERAPFEDREQAFLAGAEAAASAVLGALARLANHSADPACVMYDRAHDLIESGEYLQIEVTT